MTVLFNVRDPLTGSHSTNNKSTKDAGREPADASAVLDAAITDYIQSLLGVKQKQQWNADRRGDSCWNKTSSTKQIAMNYRKTRSQAPSNSLDGIARQQPAFS